MPQLVIFTQVLEPCRSEDARLVAQAIGKYNALGQVSRPISAGFL